MRLRTRGKISGSPSGKPCQTSTSKPNSSDTKNGTTNTRYPPINLLHKKMSRGSGFAKVTRKVPTSRSPATASNVNSSASRLKTVPIRNRKSRCPKRSENGAENVDGAPCVIPLRVIPTMGNISPWFANIVSRIDF